MLSSRWAVGLGVVKGEVVEVVVDQRGILVVDKQRARWL